MALYRYEESIVRAGSGGSAVGKAAYLEGERYTQDIGAEAVDKSAYISAGNFAVHDYTRKQEEVRHSEVMLPDDAPGWASDPETLWRAAESAERKQDGTFRDGAQLAREVKLTLPRETSHEQNKAMTREFLRREFVDKGHGVHWAIHDKQGGDGERQPHAHALVTIRRFSTAERDGVQGNKGGFERTKEHSRREYQTRHQRIRQRREAWAEVQNRHLERAGLKERVDHRSNRAILKEALAERDFEKAKRHDRVAEPKMGPRVAAKEAKGERTATGDKLRAVRAENERRSATYEFVGGFGRRAKDGFCAAREKARDTGQAFKGWCEKARDWCREKAEHFNIFAERKQEPARQEREPRWRDEVENVAAKAAAKEQRLDHDAVRYGERALAGSNLPPEQRAVWAGAVETMRREVGVERAEADARTSRMAEQMRKQDRHQAKRKDAFHRPLGADLGKPEAEREPRWRDEVGDGLGGERRWQEPRWCDGTEPEKGSAFQEELAEIQERQRAQAQRKGYGLDIGD